MNKQLKKYADKQLNVYRNEGFLNELKAKQKETQMKNRRKKILPICLSTGSALVMLAVALLCVFLINPPAVPADPDNTEQKGQKEEEVEKKTYLETDQIFKGSNLEELNGALTYFSFSGDGFTVDKCVDSHYNETLYYYVTYTDEEGLYLIYFTILTNPNYTIENSEDGYDLQGTVASYAVKYFENSESEDGIFFFTDNGVITTGKEKIYLNAEIIGFDEDSGFIEMLNTLVSAK